MSNSMMWPGEDCREAYKAVQLSLAGADGGPIPESKYDLKQVAPLTSAMTFELILLNNFEHSDFKFSDILASLFRQGQSAKNAQAS